MRVRVELARTTDIRFAENRGRTRVGFNFFGIVFYREKFKEFKTAQDQSVNQRQTSKTIPFPSQSTRYFLSSQFDGYSSGGIKSRTKWDITKLT